MGLFQSKELHMEVELSRIKDLVEHPRESLSVEIKRWINPDSPEGIAKIVKGAIALRNFGGGYFIIGFDNETLMPDRGNEPSKIRELFHVDKIQGIIGKYSSSPFEVVIEFVEREGVEYPVIVIPTGVKTPVATKSELVNRGKNLIKCDVIYIRSLLANNTPSTTIATWKDWETIVEICFDNREADVGRFLRRHLSSLRPEFFREFIQTLGNQYEEISPENILKQFVEESEKRYKELVADKKLALPETGYWEVALIIQGDVPKHTANIDFLNLIDASNPRYSGWPIWLDSRRFSDKASKPFVANGIWEAIIPIFDQAWRDSIDFVRFDPKGRFFLWRSYQEDMKSSQRNLEPFKYFDFLLPVTRSAEAIGVGLAFAKAMKCEPEKTQLVFEFKWSRLQGRELVSWANPERYITPGRTAYQDEVSSFVQIPLDTPLSALSEFVFQATEPLFQVFDGFMLSKKVVEDLTNRVIERRL
jgi:hypothetical protein